MAGTHLGELGTPRPPADITFAWFGSTIRCNPDASDLDFHEFIATASGIEWDPDAAAGDPEATKAALASLNAVSTYLKAQIHPDDWATFWMLARTNRQQTMDLMNVSKAITEALAGFPTGQPSGSPAGRPPTAGSSSANSSSAGQAMAILRGRPDLQMAVVQAQRARAEEAATGSG